MDLEPVSQRRLRDAPGIVRDGRSRYDRDYLEQESLAESRFEETLDIAIVEPAALLDQRPRQCRKRTEVFVGRQSAGPNCFDICRIQARLQPKRRMERDCPGAGVGYGVGEQHG